MNADCDEKIVDFSSHLFADLNKKLQQEQNAKSEIIFALRNIKSFQKKIINIIYKLIECESLDNFYSIIYNDLTFALSCDVSRLGIESELIDEYDSYYNENNYSGLKFLTFGCCLNIFADKNHLIINDDAIDVGNQSFKRLLFSDCNDLAVSSLHLRLYLPSFKRAAILSFGSREQLFFEKRKYDSDLLGLLAHIISATLNKLLQQDDELI